MPTTDKALLFFLLFLAVTVSSVIVLFIVNKLEKAVEEHGFYYNNILKLNNKYNFSQTRRHLVINHPVKSKKALERLNPDDVVIYYLENNINGFSENFEKAVNNKLLYARYTTEYEEIMKTDHVYPADAIPFSSVLKPSDFCKYEKKQATKKRVKDTFGITVDINASYSSPKGKNQYRRCFKYRYENVLYCYDQWINSTSYKVSAAYERSLMTDSLRYDIFKRDNFRCQICGASANDGVKLHVDHIVPVSKGGKTEPSNLQTLCERCNLGKSNKM